MRKKNESKQTVEALTDRLHQFRLNAMAEQLEELHNNTQIADMGPLELLDRLLSAQEIHTLNRTTKKYKASADLFFPMADLNDVIYDMDRHINAALVDQLSTNEYIKESRNILITSATGCGKTFFACAFGNKACESQYSVIYYTMTDFVDECRRMDEQFYLANFIKKVANYNVIILDDFLLTSINQRDAEYLYRLVSSKQRKIKPRSYIICSQLMNEEMYNRLSMASPSVADAIMSRLTAKAYRLQLEGKSMREVDIDDVLAQRKSENQDNQ